jgi:hypothetical protein
MTSPNDTTHSLSILIAITYLSEVIVYWMP